MEQTQAWIRQWIQQNRATIIRDLFSLVAIPSVSDPTSPIQPFGKACQDALDHMYALADDYGLSHRDFGRRVGKIACSEVAGAPEIGIWCHLDVVPVPNPEDWVYPPFSGTEVEGRYLIGRGIQDNKMPAVACFHVFQCLKRMGYQFRKNWSLYLGTSEENGMMDVDWFVKNENCPDLNLVPDTGFPVCTAQRGCQILRYRVPLPLKGGVTLRFKCGSNISVTPEHVDAWFSDGRTIQTQGHGFHIIRADAENAVVHMLQALQKAVPESAETLKALVTLLTDETHMGIQYSDAPSGSVHARPTQMQWENGELTVDVYSILPVTADGDVLLQSARRQAQQAHVVCDRYSLRKPVYFRADHPLVQVLTDVYRQVTGDPSEPFIMTGGNYASLLPNALGFGPGMPGREFPVSIFPQGHGDYHQCDESEDWEHIVRFMEVYAMAVLRLDEREELA